MPVFAKWVFQRSDQSNLNSWYSMLYALPRSHGCLDPTQNKGMGASSLRQLAQRDMVRGRWHRVSSVFQWIDKLINSILITKFIFWSIFAFLDSNTFQELWIYRDSKRYATCASVVPMWVPASIVISKIVECIFMFAAPFRLDWSYRNTIYTCKRSALVCGNAISSAKSIPKLASNE